MTGELDEARITDEQVAVFEREYFADKGGGPDGRSRTQATRDALRAFLRFRARQALPLSEEKTGG